jgi:hypothetical protein
MGRYSNVTCLNINKPNCEFYDSNRLCPDNCEGFVTVTSPTIKDFELLPIEKKNKVKE